MEALFVGSISGCLAITVCHPIDVIRTRMQVMSYPFSVCVSDISKREGIWGFYKGFLGPFVAQGIYKSVIFATNTFTQRHLFHSSQAAHALFASGFISGAVNAWVVAPVEIVRTKLIFEHGGGSRPSIISSVKTIVQSGGGILGLWRGVLPAIARDGPGMGLYFLAFDRCKSFFTTKELPPSLPARIFAGAMAGVGFWVVALPVDTIKTVVEARAVKATGLSSQSTAASDGALKTIVTVTNQLLNEGGVRRLYRAWPVALGRGLPSAAITLTTFDILMDYLHGK